MSYYGFPKYVSVGEKRAKAEKKIKQLKKKNPGIQPVIIEGRSLAKTWWGKEWNHNLERYADFSNRIGRGRSYVRHMAVLDLKIKPGKVEALVSGSGSRPYHVLIKIKPIPEKNWAAVRQSCKGKLGSLKKLVTGKFSKELGSMFTQERGGLFPVPKEIDFDCSCPDWAYMCKHVAATLYGVGARLDQDPGLFFVLRKVDINDLVTQTIKESKKDLLLKAKKKTSRVIEDEAGLSDMFGIDLGDEIKKEIKISKPGKNKKITATRKIEQIISNEKKGIPVSRVIEKSGMAPQKVRNILFRLKKTKRIDTVSRGVYIIL